MSPMADHGVRLEFCGEWYVPEPGSPFVIGREGDLVVDENPYLHRRFLEVVRQGELWWLCNVGGQLAATLSDADGRFQAWMAPGSALPLVFERMVVRFSAGPTSYEVALHVSDPPFDIVPTVGTAGGSTTLGRVTLTPEQHLLVVALAESSLRSSGSGRTQIPSSAEAAARLGWPLTKLNRKLDNVCQKLKRAGVQGLHGDAGNLAVDRRARLVEYALAVRLVTVNDLDLLETGGRADH